MRKIAAFIACALLLAALSVAATPAAATTRCPGAISWRSAGNHVGERVTVAGPVRGTRYASDTNGSPTFINLGRDYPDDRRFTALIWGKNRYKFADDPEVEFDQETVCVTGTVLLYRGVPEIIVSKPRQIRIP